MKISPRDLPKNTCPNRKMMKISRCRSMKNNRQKAATESVKDCLSILL